MKLIYKVLVLVLIICNSLSLKSQDLNFSPIVIDSIQPKKVRKMNTKNHMNSFSRIVAYGKINNHDTLFIYKNTLEKLIKNKELINVSDSLVIKIDTINKYQIGASVFKKPLLPPKKVISKKKLKKRYEKHKKNKFYYSANGIYIFNKSKDSSYISTIRNGLQMLTEAQNELGEWKPIEMFYTFIMCGNEYVNVILPSKSYLLIKTISYKGNFKTKIRYKIILNDKIYYSEEIEGNVNKIQFEDSRTQKNIHLEQYENLHNNN